MTKLFEGKQALVTGGSSGSRSPYRHEPGHGAVRSRHRLLSAARVCKCRRSNAALRSGRQQLNGETEPSFDRHSGRIYARRLTGSDGWVAQPDMVRILAGKSHPDFGC